MGMSDISSLPPARDPKMPSDAIASGLSETSQNPWSSRLVLFLRVMAVLAMFKGLYHWALVTGFIGKGDEAFDAHTLAWQAATIYFSVIELVAAVGLWLATPWGAVMWLTSVVSTAVIELMFPEIYGGSLIVVAVEVLFLALYLALAFMAAKNRPA